MRRLLPLLAVALAALAAAPAALAHVDIEPFELVPGQPQRVTFYAPNEGKAPASVLEVTVPESVEIAVVEAVPGWTATVDGRTIVWRGGSILVGQYGLFSALVAAPDEEQALEFRTTLRYDDGFRQVFNPIAFARAAKDPAARDEAGRTMGKYALGLAIAALALAVAAAFVALFTWLRSGDRPAGDPPAGAPGASAAPPPAEG